MTAQNATAPVFGKNLPIDADGGDDVPKVLAGTVRAPRLQILLNGNQMQGVRDRRRHDLDELARDGQAVQAIVWS